MRMGDDKKNESESAAPRKAILAMEIAGALTAAKDLAEASIINEEQHTSLQ